MNISYLYDQKNLKVERKLDELNVDLESMRKRKRNWYKDIGRRSRGPGESASPSLNFGGGRQSMGS